MIQPITAKVKLSDDSGVLDKTVETYRSAVQECIDWGFEFCVESRRELHDLTYDKLRSQFGLQAQLTTCVISQAWEMLNKEGHTKPIVKSFFARYNFPRSASIKGDWEELSLATIEGRRKFDLDIPECFEKYLDWEVRESTLIRDRKGRFFINFTFAKEVVVDDSCDGRVVGVDLGVNKLAVTSDGDFYGTSVKGRRISRDNFVARLQAKGTHAAHKRLKAFGGRWKRFMRHRNHEISRNIVDKLSRGDTIVMEELAGIRETAGYNKWVHKWAFRQLQDFIEYKARLAGVRVVYVDPRNTSKTCNECGSMDTVRKGRRTGWFECRNCGFTLDSDLNGARNIADTYTVTTASG